MVKRRVKKYGNSKIIRVPEFEENEEVFIYSHEEIKALLQSLRKDLIIFTEEELNKYLMQKLQEKEKVKEFNEINHDSVNNNKLEYP